MNKKKIKVLVTGSSGFIGTNLVPVLKEVCEVETIDVRFQCDIFDTGFYVFVKDCDVVIHLAALTSVEQSFKNPGESYRVNTLGTAKVLELCHRYKKRLIYPSSAAVYHPELSPYADSKRLAEELVWSMRKSIPVVIFRLFNVYGQHMNPNSGSVMYNFLNNKDIVVFGDGEQTRDFIHVRDVCDIIKSAVFQKKWNGHIVDLGTGEAYSTNFIAGLFAHYRNKKIGYKPPRREIKWSSANRQMLDKLYGKKLTTNIEEDIKALCTQV